MMKYILIMAFTYGSSAPAFFSAEFNSMQACQTASAAVFKQADQNLTIRVNVCAAKGEQR